MLKYGIFVGGNIMNDSSKSITLSKWAGPVQATPYPIQRISPTIEKNLAQAEQPIKLIANSLESKLSIIDQQILQLQETADALIQEARKNVELHLIPCSVAKKAEGVYHLYKREDGSKFFSIIAPHEWGSLFKFEFINSYYLNHDLTWKDL